MAIDDLKTSDEEYPRLLSKNRTLAVKHKLCVVIVNIFSVLMQ